MGLISDILLLAGTLGAALYCFVLSRRLARFNDLEKGVGGAVAVLSVQVDEMTRALETAQRDSTASVQRIETLTRRAEEAGSRLELLMASMHDISDAPAGRPARVVRRQRRAEAADTGEGVA